MKYTSKKNGYTGIVEKGNFPGIGKHWDYTVFNDKGKFVYHATLEGPMSKEALQEDVDNFPEFIKMLTEGF